MSKTSKKTLAALWALLEQEYKHLGGGELFVTVHGPDLGSLLDDADRLKELEDDMLSFGSSIVESLHGACSERDDLLIERDLLRAVVNADVHTCHLPEHIGECKRCPSVAALEAYYASEGPDND